MGKTREIRKFNHRSTEKSTMMENIAMNETMKSTLKKISHKKTLAMDNAIKEKIGIGKEIDHGQKEFKFFLQSSIEY